MSDTPAIQSTEGVYVGGAIMSQIWVNNHTGNMIFICLVVGALDNKLIYMVYSISFQTFFIQAFKIIVDSWKFSMLLLYVL